MYSCLCMVVVLVTAAPSNTLAPAGPSTRLTTTHRVSRTDDSTEAHFSLGVVSPVTSHTLALQTRLTHCTSVVTANYTGQVLRITTTYTEHGPTTVAFEDRRVGGVVPGHEVLRLMWRPKEEKLIATMPTTSLTLTTGQEGEAGGRWWRLWARDCEGDAETSGENCELPQPNQVLGGETAGPRAGRGVVMRTHFSDSLWRLSVDTFIPGEQRRVLNLTFIAHQGEQWDMSLEAPDLSLAFECESRIWKSGGKQYRQVAGEVRSTESDASLKLTYFVHEKLDRESEVDDVCLGGGGCGDGEVQRSSEKSKFHTNSDHILCLEESQESSLNNVRSCTDHKPKQDLKEWTEYEGDHPYWVQKRSEGAMDGRKSVASDVTQEIRQNIISNIINFSSNMTTFVSSDGGRSIRILQRSHLAFCPRLNWALNQIFWFRHDWSGWEYVVSTWDWGNMVVKGDWGVSFLQWYQKTFTFSFDQGAVFPSTQLVLDFHDRRSFKVWVKWPALASALAISLTLQEEKYILLVEDVDEFVGEGGAEVVARVVVRHTIAGLALSCFTNAAKIQSFHAAAAAHFAQAWTSPDVCGEVPDHNTIEKFLQDLFGRSPASLWADLLQEGRRLLLGSGSKAYLDYLREVFAEEMSSAGGDLWDLALAALERTGTLKARGEEVEVLAPWKWLALVQTWWTQAFGDGAGRCGGGKLMIRLLKVLDEAFEEDDYW